MDLEDGSEEMYNAWHDGAKLTWYEHEEEMRSFSKKHPNIVFKLTGDGEESDDLWHKYFKNGLMQECRVKITIDEYDEEKLV